MLFNFTLRPLEDIQSWGEEGQVSLSWFGLTDGWYWLQVGQDELFRYSDPVLQKWKEAGSQMATPYVDYYVVRLWEDLQEILPHILEPVPASVLQRIIPGHQAHLWKEKLSVHLFPADDLDDDSPQDELNWERYSQAITWFDQRRLFMQYLQNSPATWFWTDGDFLYISWDNEDALFEGVPVWTAQSGKFAMPLKSFLDELISFDQRLIQAMQARVEAIKKDWPRPEVTIDLDALIQEHHDRAAWMKKAFEDVRLTPPTQWDLVLNSLERLEQMGFPAPF